MKEAIERSQMAEGNLCNKENDGEDSDGESEVQEDDTKMKNIYVYEDSSLSTIIAPAKVCSVQRSAHRNSTQDSVELDHLRSSIIKKLPESVRGWAVLLSVLSSTVFGYERKVQKSLTSPPVVFGQLSGENGNHQNPYHQHPLQQIYKKMTLAENSILRRPFQPAMFMRGTVASTAAFFLRGPSSSSTDHIRFREILNMSQDGAKIGVDWELPLLPKERNNKTMDERKREIVKGPIQQPVVMILHGMNNNSNFGYIRSLARACTDKGWVALGFNFRGCGGVPLNTPRMYQGAYTGDLRSAVQQISSRLDQGIPLFLVGHSLSANLVIKYLGEEGFSGTLPPNLAAGVALANPFHIGGKNISSILSAVLTLGTRKDILTNWSTLRQSMKNDPYLSAAVRNALLSSTLPEFEEALCNSFARNESTHPFAFRVGFENRESYCVNASSFSHCRHISVPTMQLIAGDDKIAYKNFQNKFNHNILNPNIMVVETKTGGHLGWLESLPGGSSFSLGTSWANTAVTDFIAAVLETQWKQPNKITSGEDSSVDSVRSAYARRQSSRIQSKL